MKFVVIPLILFSLLSHAVSRVGGGKIQSQLSDFEMELPAEYQVLQQVGVEQVMARGPIMYSANGGYIDLKIFISEFVHYFKNIQHLNPEDLTKWMAQANWQEFATADHCVRGFKQTNNTLASYVFTWGSGKGFVLNMANVSVSDTTVQQMLSTLRLAPGACSWK